MKTLDRYMLIVCTTSLGVSLVGLYLMKKLEVKTVPLDYVIEHNSVGLDRGKMDEVFEQIVQKNLKASSIPTTKRGY